MSVVLKRGDHGRPQKFFQGGQPQDFTYPVHVADDAMQMNVHKTLCPSYTITKMLLVTATVVKIALRWRSNASFSFMLLFKQYKTTKLTAISSHCLAAYSAKVAACSLKGCARKRQPKIRRARKNELPEVFCF